MKKTMFKKRELLWLYFYLWQIELSIDRALYGRWNEMVEFLDSRVQLNMAVKKLGENINFNVGKELMMTASPTYYSLNYIYRRAFRKFFLYEDEKKYIYSVLVNYGQFREMIGKPKPETLIDLRMQICEGKEIIEKIFGRRHLATYGYVSHFDHSDFIEVKEIEELID